MKRKKIERRRYFSRSEKHEILNKSKGRCCHCGKRLVIGDNFTVEHIIPISQGGTNDMFNLVALCEECNKNKADNIYLPSSYLIYLNSNIKKKLDKGFDAFCKEMSYVTRQNMFYADKIEVPLDMCFDVHRSNRLNTVFKATLHKAYYSDLDDLYSFCLKYYKNTGIDIDVWTLLSTYFDLGCIYYTKTMKGNIDFVILAGILSLRDVALSDFPVMYHVDFFILVDPDIDLSEDMTIRKKRNSSGRGTIREGYYNSLSHIKLDAVLNKIEEVFIRSKLDFGLNSKVGMHALSWYESDKQLNTWMRDSYIARNFEILESDVVKYVNTQWDVSHMSICDKVYEGWRDFIGPLYNCEDEINLYRVRVDVKYKDEVEEAAMELRKCISGEISLAKN